jgi:hypothetical protein
MGFSVRFFDIGRRDIYLAATLTDLSHAGALEKAVL